VKQLGGKLAGEWLVECQAPLVGELTATAAVTLLVTLAARKASSGRRARLFP
jgi:hypothetical protein